MPSESASRYDHIEGAVLGLAVGDALGVPAEFMHRDLLRSDPVNSMRAGGAHGQPAGTWSDDTSMTLCAMNSLSACGPDPDDQMRRFSNWLWSAENTARGEVFDVGGATKSAIFRFVKGTPALSCGEQAENTCGNGSLMRILPTALYLIGQGVRSLEDRSARIIHDASRCTHAHPRCLMACGVYCAVVFRLYDGTCLTDAVDSALRSALAYYASRPEFAPVYPDFLPLLNTQLLPEAAIQSTGYVLHTLQAALWCLLTTSDYAPCVCRAVNLGEDSDTTAAVAGGLAGLWYGAGHIPPAWAKATARYDMLQHRCRHFYLRCFPTPGEAAPRPAKGGTDPFSQG